MKKKRTGLKIFVIVAIVLVLFFSLINFITDFLWFRELGYVSVFFTKLFTQLKIVVPVFIVVTFFAYIYLKVLKLGYFKKIVSSEITDEKRLNKITWGLAAAFGFLTAFFSASRLWFEVLQFFNSTDFANTDPLFNNNISFYIMKLAFIKGVNDLLIGILVVFALLTVAYYGVLISMHKPEFWDEEPDYEPEDEKPQKDAKRGTIPGGGFGDGGFGDFFDNMKRQFGDQFGGAGHDRQKTRRSVNTSNFWKLLDIAKTQVIIVGVILFLMIGVNFFLQQYDLLQSHRGMVYGAGYTDTHVMLWVYRFLVLLSAAAAVMVIVGLKKKQFKKILVVPAVMIVFALIGGGVAPLVQNFIVSPDEINKESKYLESNIKYTRDAYDLSNVEVKPFSASKALKSSDIAKNAETIKNIRINDYTPAEKFYNQTQSIRQYYEFNNVDVDRYEVNGELTQTFLSAREIDENKINDTWLNRHIKYTHGYGVTLSRVNEITSSGQPKMLVSNIPPESDVSSTKIKRPQIYFGELTNDYILVNTNEDEFDYPDGNSNKYTQYKGNAGINMNFFNRLLFSIRQHSLKLLVSSNVDRNSKIVINRNIEKRVQTIMPYLTYEEDPYMCTVDGNLYWIIDAYTTSNKYPYSEPYDEFSGNVNYIRNSVKVVIDAYNGNTNYYIVDKKDPIAQTYKKIYPDLFKNGDDMPAGIKKHIRYPHLMFETQAKTYERYHMTDMKVFYQKEDAWAVSNEMYGTEETEMGSQYYVMSLPGETKTEFVSSIPYTPRDKKNMTGLFVARNDGENYGKLILYQLPKSKVVYGPMQVEAQIDQNTEISKEFSLWESNGSSYSRGNMFVIPIEDSLLYVEPVYLEAKNSSIPEVKRVIVAFNDQIAYEPTLAEALNELFGKGSANEDQGNNNSDGNSGKNKKLTYKEIIKKAQKAFENAEKAQKKGDWAEYGRQQKRLSKYLNTLK